MVLPASWSAALILLILSAILLAAWPNLFKAAGRYRFELFSMDFGVGALLCALLAAFTLGTLGAQLNYSDTMLVAGRRAELMAVVSGGVFALGNICYLATIALIGLSNATLLTFGVMGAVVSGMEAVHGHYLTGGFALLVFAAAAYAAIQAGKAARAVSEARKPGQSKQDLPVPASTKGTVTGIAAGLTFGVLLPVVRMAEGEQLGIGAYGGILLGSVGLLLTTVLLNFFFLNVSLEGGNLGFANYLSTSMRDHLRGAASGAVWTAGALALYTAVTGGAEVTRFDGWSAVLAAAVLATMSGILIWQKGPQSDAARWNKMAAGGLFIVGTVLFLAALH